MFCKKCGTYISNNAQFCPKCGERININQNFNNQGNYPNNNQNNSFFNGYNNSNRNDIPIMYNNQGFNNQGFKEKKNNSKIKGILFALIALILVLCIIAVNKIVFIKKMNSKETLKNVNVQGGVVRDKMLRLKGDGKDKVTVMVYMNGSNLESESGAATLDLQEMMDAKIGDNVNLIVFTGGTSTWQNNIISGDRSQIYKIDNEGIQCLEDDLDQMNIGESDTLSYFIDYCKDNYPSNRRILLMWNHGGGPVYGFGYDENYDGDSLTLNEIQDGLRESRTTFDFIGFDACLMGSLEVCCALYDYADYLLISEDFESGYGWEYSNWLKQLSDDTSIRTTKLAKTVVNDFVEESNSCKANGILSLVDLSYTKLLYTAWTTFAYSAKDELLKANYSFEMNESERAKPKITDYSAVDMMATASTIDSDEADALEAAISYTVSISSSTENDNYMTGLSVTLPYGDKDFYDALYDIFIDCGMDSKYLDLLEEFTTVEEEDYDWNDWEWNGWEDYEDDDWEDWEDWNYWDEYEDNDYEWSDDYEFTYDDDEIN